MNQFHAAATSSQLGLLLDPALGYTEASFLKLKNRLDQQHYCFPMTIESAQLVEKLLNDLSASTQGFQAQKQQLEQSQANIVDIERLISPLRKENQRLVQENNELHQEMIRVKEACDEQEDQWKNTFNLLMGEKNDLKFVLAQKDQQISLNYNEKDKVQQKVNSLLAKFYIPEKERHGLANLPHEIIANSLQEIANIQVRATKQAFDLQKPLRPQEQQQENIDLERPFQQDEEQKLRIQSLKASDEKNVKLQLQIKDLQNLIDEYKVRMEQLENKIFNRDQEIKRLNSKIELCSIGPNQLKNIQQKYESEEVVIKNQRLNDQIDFLTKENHQQEAQIVHMKAELARTEGLRVVNDQLKSRSKSVIKENERLEKQVQEKDKFMKSHTQRLKKNMELSQRETEEEKSKLERQERALSKQQDEINRLQDVIQQMLEGKKVTEQVQSAYHSDKRAYQASLDNLRKDNAELQQKVSQQAQQMQVQAREAMHLNDQVFTSQNKVQVLQREVELLGKSKQDLHQDLQSSQSRLFNLEETLNGMKSENAQFANSNADLEKQVDRLKSQCTFKDDLLEKMKNEQYRIKEESTQSVLGKRQFQTYYEQSTEENGLLRKEAVALREVNKQNLQKLDDMESFVKEASLKLQIAEEQKEQFQNQSVLNRNKLAEYQAMCKQQQAQINELERLGVSLQNVERRNADLEKKNLELTSEISSFQKSTLELRLQCSENAQKIDNLNQTIAHQSEEIQFVKRGKAETEAQVNKLQQESIDAGKRALSLQSKSFLAETLQKELERQRQNESNLSAHCQQLKERNLALEQSLDQQKRNFQHNEENRLDLTKQAQTSQVELQFLTQKQVAVETECSQLIEKCAKMEHHLQKMGQERQAMEKTLQDSQVSLKNYKQTAQELQMDLANVNSQLTQSKLLLQSSERQNGDLTNRLVQKNQEMNKASQQINSLNVESQRWQKRAEECEARCTEGLLALKQEQESVLQLHRQQQALVEANGQLKESLLRQTIEQEKSKGQLDNILHESSEQNQKAAMLQQQINSEEMLKQKRETEIITLRSKSDMKDKQIVDLEFHVRRLQDEVRALTSHLQASFNLGGATAHNKQFKEEELNQVKDKLAELTRENQQLVNQLVASEAHQYQQMPQIINKQNAHNINPIDNSNELSTLNRSLWVENDCKSRDLFEAQKKIMYLEGVLMQERKEKCELIQQSGYKMEGQPVFSRTGSSAKSKRDNQHQQYDSHQLGRIVSQQLYSSEFHQ